MRVQDAMDKLARREKLNVGERMDPAMSISEQEEADLYYEALVAWNMDQCKADRAESERITKANLSYYSGYCSKETRRRAGRLFHLGGCI